MYATDKTLKEQGEKLSVEARAKLSKPLDEARTVVDKSDAKKDDFEQAIKALEEANRAVAEELYRSTAEQEDAGTGDSSEDVIDAEFEDSSEPDA